MELTHKSLCTIAVSWLKRQNGPRCKVAVSEVPSGFNGEMPDAIGFCYDYHYECSVMVEVKVSRSDFLNDKKKPHRNGTTVGMGNYRYYMCPTDLIKPEELPDKFGLIYVNSRGHCSLVVSPLIEQKLMVRKELLKASYFESDTAREMCLMARLLARIGDADKLNNTLKELRNQSTYYENKYRTEVKLHDHTRSEHMKLLMNELEA